MKSTARKYWILLGLLLGGCFLIIILPFLDMLPMRVEVKKDVYLQQGKDYYEQGKYQAAVLALKNVLQADPTDSQAHYHLGLTYLKLGEISDAIGALQQSIRYSPEFTEGQLKLGELYYLVKEYTQARTKAQLVLEQAPDKVDGYVLLGQVTAAEGHIHEALKIAHKALSLAPNHLEGHLLLGSLHFLNREYEQAKGILQQAVITHRRAIDAHLALGTYYQARCPFRKSYASTFWRGYHVEWGHCHVMLGHPSLAIRSSTMPVPLAPRVTLADDEQSRLAAIVRAHSTPQAFAFRCQLILRAAAPDRPSNLQVRPGVAL